MGTPSPLPVMDGVTAGQALSPAVAIVWLLAPEPLSPPALPASPQPPPTPPPIIYAILVAALSAGRGYRIHQTSHFSGIRSSNSFLQGREVQHPPPFIFFFFSCKAEQMLISSWQQGQELLSTSARSRSTRGQASPRGPGNCACAGQRCRNWGAPPSLRVPPLPAQPLPSLLSCNPQTGRQQSPVTPRLASYHWDTPCPCTPKENSPPLFPSWAAPGTVQRRYEKSCPPAHAILGLIF